MIKDLKENILIMNKEVTDLTRETIPNSKLYKKKIL